MPGDTAGKVTVMALDSIMGVPSGDVHISSHQYIWGLDTGL